jgi:HSP20 family protein
MAEKQSDVAAREERHIARRDPFTRFGNPFRRLERFAEDMDRVFDDFGLGRSPLGSRLGRSWWRSPWRGASMPDTDVWTPDIDVFQRDHELVVRADLPGLRREDVKVEVTENAITIQGERRHETAEQKEGVYRSERSYGAFSRVIGLPEGTITDQAKANFKDGVLEITMPTPPEHVTRGRRLEITEPSSTKR